VLDGARHVGGGEDPLDADLIDELVVASSIPIVVFERTTHL
jgi:hypothetical protein